MKITAFIMLIICLHVSAATLAQNVTLSEHKASLEKVIGEIKQQTGYSFFYNEDWLKQAQPVDLDVKNSPLEKALELCFSNQPFSYAIVNKTIVLKLKPQPKVEVAVPVSVSGRVTDSLGTPLIGATIVNKTTNKSAITDDKGEFIISGQSGDPIIVTFVGFKSYIFTITNDNAFQNIILHASSSKLSEVVVVNTGYQTLPAERATGAFDQLGTQEINREVSTNILDRLNGLVSGIQQSASQSNGLPTQVTTTPNNIRTGIIIRGISTFSVNTVGTDPLIVLDNFPYDGDLSNINPNDIESVTILKDAAAASIWGARAGNGVIVLTTKKGRYNHKMQIDFTANTTFTKKPDIFKDPNFLDANEYVNIETYLFNKGYYDATLSNTTTYPAYSPVVALLAQERSGTISAANATSQINALRNIDSRDQILQYGYREGVNQQYSFGVKGGSENMTYSLRVGRDENKLNTVGDNFNRTTISANSTYIPFRNFEINTSINYNKSDYNANGGQIGFGYQPYELFADANGNPLPITRAYSTSYINSVLKEGLLDWNYYPLSDLRNSDNTTNTSDLLLRISGKYKITSYLNIEAQYQNETQTIINNNYQDQQTYSTTNLINEFSQYNSTTGKITYNFPLGGILNNSTTIYDENNYRLQASLNKTIHNDHTINAIAGAEIRQIVTSGNQFVYYGYNPSFGTSTNNLNYNTSYPTNPAFSATIPNPAGNLGGTELRYISYFADAAYSYKDRYTFSLSGREDGSNLFGVNINNKITPVWSTGVAWNFSKESFYHSDFFPYLKLRTTYGFNGNVYNGSAYVTGQYSTGQQTNATIIDALTAPNPDLTWEKVRTINIGIDFATKGNILYGSIDLYKKDGENLIEPVNLTPSTGFTSFSGNAASTSGKGLELTLSSNIINRTFKWTSTLISNFLSDVIKKYDVTLTSGSISSSLYGGGAFMNEAGKPLQSIFSYKWAGLDPTNGNPRGYLNGQVSENYAGIINNYKPDSLMYSGSATPTQFGTWRNDFGYKRFTLSVMIAYELGYYFRRPSITGNYADIVTNTSFGNGNSDYAKAWQKPGDELITNVPSLVYPSNSQRATFYDYSQTLVQSGDNIRLKDVRLAYDLSPIVKRAQFSNLQIFTYANNIGIIWRKNKYGLDPDNYQSWPVPFSISFGLQATLK